MPRGYRCVVLTLLGWLALAASNPKAEQSKTAKRSQEAAPTAQSIPAPPPSPADNPPTQFLAYPGYDPDPCYHAKDKDAADLCAQWRAAISGEKAAHEARRATNWAILATFLSAATVIGLIISLYQTAGALGEARRGNRLNLLFEQRARREGRVLAAEQAAAIAIAERNANAATTLVEITEKNSQRELRAYVSTSMPSIRSIGPRIISAEMEFTNDGKTPAKITLVSQCAWIGVFPSLDPHKIGPAPDRYYHIKPFLMSGGTGKILLYVDDADDIVSLAGKDIAYYVYGRIEYEDVFDNPQWTEFAYRICGPIMVGGKLSACVDGNQAT